MEHGKEHSNWTRMSFKGNKVWVAAGDDQKPIVEKGKALIKYNLKQDHEYWVRAENLKSDAPENLVKKGEGKRKTKPAAGKSDTPKQVSHDEPGVIHAFTDGASSGNPGPSGIGIVLRYGQHEKKISRFIGQGTNNIAELEAIRVALNAIKNPQLPIRIYTDSSYALGLLAKGWKPKKNQELVETIKTEMKRFRDLTFVKVQGHAGIEGNEHADKLATSAIAENPQGS